MKKGFTLVEVLLAIALLGLITVSFLPALSNGYSNLIGNKKLTEELFLAQSQIEQAINEEKFIEGAEFSKEIFGVKIKGNNIEVEIEDYGTLFVFQPKEEEYVTPKIIRDINSMLPSIVKLSVFYNNSEQAISSARFKEVDLFKNINVLNDNIKFLVDKKYYKIEDTKTWLVNIFRWYTSSQTSYDESFTMDNYHIIKEWNAARPLLSYLEAREIQSIANIQNDPDYNTLNFLELITELNTTNTELINQFGNRYFYYSVTPFAISGRIGKEEFSNAVYIIAPRLEIDRAIYGPEDKQISIVFRSPVQDIFDIDKIELNPDLPDLEAIYIDPGNPSIVIIEFLEPLDTSINLDNNILHRGAVKCLNYGAIDIWSGNQPIGKFTIEGN